jgi:hypothetical protein
MAMRGALTWRVTQVHSEHRDHHHFQRILDLSTRKICSDNQGHLTNLSIWFPVKT